MTVYIFASEHNIIMYLPYAIPHATLYTLYTSYMYVIGMSQDIGRMMAFTPGWLENQSVWLHMSYKFYLELLRAGLYDEFFNEIKTGLVPFMDPKVSIV